MKTQVFCLEQLVDQYEWVLQVCSDTIYSYAQCGNKVEALIETELYP